MPKVKLAGEVCCGHCGDCCSSCGRVADHFTVVFGRWYCDECYLASPQRSPRPLRPPLPRPRVAKDPVTAGELFDAIKEMWVPTGAFIEVDGKRVTGMRVTGTPGIDRTLHLTID